MPGLNDWLGFGGGVGVTNPVATQEDLEEEARKRLAGAAPVAAQPRLNVPGASTMMPPGAGQLTGFAGGAGGIMPTTPAVPGPAAPPAGGYANPGAGPPLGANIGLGRAGTAGVADFAEGLKRFREGQGAIRPEATGLTGGRFVNSPEGTYHYAPGTIDALYANRDKQSLDEYLGLSKEAFAHGKQAADEYLGVGKLGVESRQAGVSERGATVNERDIALREQKQGFEQSMNTDERKFWQGRIALGDSPEAATQKVISMREAVGGPTRSPFGGPTPTGGAAPPGAPGAVGPDGKPVVEPSAGPMPGLDTQAPWMQQLGLSRSQVTTLQDAVKAGGFGPAVAQLRSSPGMTPEKFQAMIPALQQFAEHHGGAAQFRGLVDPSSFTQWLRRGYRTVATPFGGGTYSPEEITGSLMANQMGVRQAGVPGAVNVGGYSPASLREYLTGQRPRPGVAP